MYVNDTKRGYEVRNAAVTESVPPAILQRSERCIRYPSSPDCRRLRRVAAIICQGDTAGVIPDDINHKRIPSRCGSVEGNQAFVPLEI